MSFQSSNPSVRHALGVVQRHRGLILVVFTVLMAVSGFVISKAPRSFQATANVLIVNGTSRNDPTLSSTDLPSIVGSTVVLERVQRTLGISTPLLTMKKNLSAKPPAYRAGIMRIQYTDSDRNRAALVVNGVADELARYYTALSTARYDDDLRALDDELARQKKRLENIDAQLRAQGGAFLPADDSQDASSGNQLGSLRSARAAANADLQGDIAHAQAASVDARRDVLLNDPLYQQLQTSLTKASAELDDARSRYTAQYPGLAELQGRVESLKAAVAQEENRVLSSQSAASGSPESVKAQAAVATDRARVAALDEQLTGGTSDANSAGRLELLQLERDEVIHEYQSVAARRAQSLADRADALSLGSVEVVDRAIPSEDQAGVGPIKLSLIAAFFMAIIALGSAFLVDQFDPSLRRISQIEALYGRPLIATLTTSQRTLVTTHHALPTPHRDIE